MRRHRVLVIAVAMLMVVAACQPAQQQETSTTTEPKTTTTQAASTAPSTTAAEAEAPAPEPIKIGIVSFLTGSAAEPFGIPARDAAKTIIDRLNAGEGPAPYDQPGIGGRPIEIVLVDESGGADKQVTEYRRLVLDEKVDVVIGYISSGDCSALAPVVEELQTLTIFFDCGTNAIFEEINPNPQYLFRTAGHQILDSVGAARYVVDQFSGVTTVAGINQNYAWGQDSWGAFSASLQQLKPDVNLVDALFPDLFAGAYATEISTLQTETPDVIHSSFWGGDLESFIVQAVPRGLHQQSTLVLTTADTLMPRLRDQLPPGVVVGGRGPHGALAPDSPLNDWLVDTYRSFVGLRPVYPAYHMAQAIFGLKAAYEKAMEQAGGQPDVEQVIAAFEGLEFETPSGLIQMALANGHQAIEPSTYGTTGEFDPDLGEPRMVNVVSYPAACVNPPDGVASLDWIASGFEGAEC